VRIAIAHYQFETIHPFLDGNGRIGRLLITLYLVSKGILDKPLLYLSAFFEKNKGLYYDNLTFVRQKNDLVQWIKYFLVGIETTSANAISTFTEVLAMKTRIEAELHSKWGRRSGSAYNLFQYLLKNPVVRIKDVEKICDLSTKAAGDLVESFETAGFLKEFSGQSRNRVFVFEQYINLFK
jgi:Fic family protein